MKKYLVNEIFYSLQGEGMRAGTANVFVRFAGCNLQCQMAPGPLSPGGWDCDTQFSGGLQYTAEELELEMKRVGGLCRCVILTGGEPLLQVDEELLSCLRKDWYIAVETNGTQPIPSGIDWVTCSPKVAEHAVQVVQADELKYVLHAGQALPHPQCKATHLLVSPPFTPDGVDYASLQWCMRIVESHPQWRLSMQLHKLWGAR